jgi:DNA-binding winged helix-turn-helix (wHTH) protein
MYALVLSDNIFTSSFLSRGLKYENIQSIPLSFHNFDPNSVNIKEFDCAIIKVDSKTGEKIDPILNILNYFPEKPLYLIKPYSVNISTDQKNIIVTNNGTSIRQIAYDMKKRINGSIMKNKENIIKVADLLLNLETRMALRFDSKFNLRNKEFHLLEFLMRNTDMVFSRQKILEQVWDRNANMFTNTIDVHINVLRRKLDHKVNFRLIETAHCNGYIMHSEPFG